jgi:hypothetical protein
MEVNEIDDLPGYLGCLRTHPGESGTLLKVLVSVTNSFLARDLDDNAVQVAPRRVSRQQCSPPARCCPRKTGASLGASCSTG